MVGPGLRGAEPLGNRAAGDDGDTRDGVGRGIQQVVAGITVGHKGMWSGDTGRTGQIEPTYHERQPSILPLPGVSEWALGSGAFVTYLDIYRGISRYWR